jgi:hypothetical protein
MMSEILLRGEMTLIFAALKSYFRKKFVRTGIQNTNDRRVRLTTEHTRIWRPLDLDLRICNASVSVYDRAICHFREMCLQAWSRAAVYSANEDCRGGLFFPSLV